MRLPENREKIRCGQIWRKKDIGLLVQLTGRSGKGSFSYRKVLSGKSQGHSVTEKDLYLFWEKVN